MYVFYVVLVTNIGYFIYSFNWRFLITELECVYCAVRTRTLNVIQVKFCLQSVESNGKTLRYSIFSPFLWLSIMKTDTSIVLISYDALILSRLR